MDDSAFDKLTRSFALPSRRAIFSALGAALFPALFDDGGEDARAKPKRGRSGNRGHDADAVQASGKKGKKKGKGKKKKKKKGGGGQAPPDEANFVRPSCTRDGLGCAAGEGLYGPCCGCCSEGGTCQPGTTTAACGLVGASCDICVDRAGMICQNRRCCIPNYLPCSGDNDECCDNVCLIVEGGMVCCPEGQSCSSTSGWSCCEPGQRCDDEKGCVCNEEDCKALQGCCQDGHCAPGGDDNACGVDGKACKNCLPDGRCVGGQCVTSTCPPQCPEGMSCCQALGKCTDTGFTLCPHPNGSGKIINCPPGWICCYDFSDGSNNCSSDGSCGHGYTRLSEIDCSA
jgi:hypothetical protein